MNKPVTRPIAEQVCMVIHYDNSCRRSSSLSATWQRLPQSETFHLGIFLTQFAVRARAEKDCYGRVTSAG